MDLETVSRGKEEQPMIHSPFCHNDKSSKNLNTITYNSFSIPGNISLRSNESGVKVEDA